MLTAFALYGVGEGVIMAAPHIGLLLIVLNWIVVTSLGVSVRCPVGEREIGG
jgi:hypothetical protein